MDWVIYTIGIHFLVFWRQRAQDQGTSRDTPGKLLFQTSFFPYPNPMEMASASYKGEPNPAGSLSLCIPFKLNFPKAFFSWWIRTSIHDFSIEKNSQTMSHCGLQKGEQICFCCVKPPCQVTQKNCCSLLWVPEWGWLVGNDTSGKKPMGLRGCTGGYLIPFVVL